LKKHILILFLVLSMLLSGCSEKKSLKIEYLDIQETTEIIHTWVESKSTSNGFYIGNLEDENTIYLYINYKNIENEIFYSVPKVEIHYSDHKLNVTATPRVSDTPYEKVFVIQAEKKKIQDIVLNQETLKITEIEKLNLK